MFLEEEEEEDESSFRESFKPASAHSPKELDLHSSDLQVFRCKGPFIYYVIYEWLLIIIHIGSKSIRFPLDHCRPLKHHLTGSSAAWHRIAKTQKFLKCCRPKNFTGSSGYHAPLHTWINGCFCKERPPDFLQQRALCYHHNNNNPRTCIRTLAVTGSSTFNSQNS